MRKFWDPYADFIKTTLPNGLDVYCLHIPDRPVTVKFLIHSGANCDPIGKEGTAHLLEHLVSANVDGFEQDKIETFFKKCGDRPYLGGTGIFRTTYGFRIPINKGILARSLAIFGKMLLDGRIRKHIERERAIVVKEFHKYHEYRSIFDQIMDVNRSFYEGHCRSRFIDAIGTPESISRITEQDIRSYRDLCYVPKNMSVFYAGGMPVDSFLGILEKSPFFASRPGNRIPLGKVAYIVKIPEKRAFEIKISDHLNPETPSKVGTYLSKARIPGIVSKSALEIAAEMLGKIVFDEIRKNRKWTYAANATVSTIPPFLELGINAKKMDVKALDLMDNVLDDCLAKAASDIGLFKTIRQERISSAMLRDVTCEKICNMSADDVVLHGKIVSAHEMVDGYRKTTANEISFIFEDLMRPECRITVIERP